VKPLRSLIRFLSDIANFSLTVRFEATPGEPIQFYVTKCDKIGCRRVCKLNDLVELVGLEPTASSLRTTRSPN
jgi:hypothetical protein